MRTRSQAVRQGAATALADSLVKGAAVEKAVQNAEPPAVVEVVSALRNGEAFGPPVKPAPPPLFASANARAGSAEIGDDYERITEVIFSLDAAKDYDELEKNLEVGEQRGDFKTLQQHLDKAEDRARRAHRIYLGAKVELARWEAESAKVEAKMRDAALSELEAEKAAGERKKAITDADVEARESALYPDECEHQRVKRAKLRGVVEHLERLADLWRGRCHSLGTMISTLRK